MPKRIRGLRRVTAGRAGWDGCLCQSCSQEIAQKRSPIAGQRNFFCATRAQRTVPESRVTMSECAARMTNTKITKSLGRPLKIVAKLNPLHHANAERKQCRA